MKSDKELILEGMSQEDIAFLKEIYEPQVVAIPPEDARRSMCVMPDGEIRSYGMDRKNAVHGKGRVIYLSSKDGGLSWKKRLAPAGSLGAASRLPWRGRYVTVCEADRNVDTGVYAMWSDVGPDDTKPFRKKISNKRYYDIFQPVIFEGRRLFCCAQYVDENGDYHPVVMFSDNDGEDWHIKELNSAPRFQIAPPHRGLRWNNNGSECSLTQLPDKSLLLIARTSLDYFWFYQSFDNGETWTQGGQSSFHGTLTTPFFCKLSDGRIILFWNNTRPLPEADPKTLFPLPDHEILQGRSEDVFTNRDVAHAAITTDGKCWRGAREIFLSQIRNDADYRTKGGSLSSLDKSVHQFQALELPFDKILVALGQHEISRKIIIFDINWLYETKRLENFGMGLGNLSTHVYLKSISGCMARKGYPGHCQWNRTNGAVLMPDPDGQGGEALYLSQIDDPRLVTKTQGAVWNFPALAKGRIKFDIFVAGRGLRIYLNDHWCNPCDSTIDEFVLFSFVYSGAGHKNQWRTLILEYDTEKRVMNVFDENGSKTPYEMKRDCHLGISYLQLQTFGELSDEGSYIKNLASEAMD